MTIYLPQMIRRYITKTQMYTSALLAFQVLSSINPATQTNTKTLLNTIKRNKNKLLK